MINEKRLFQRILELGEIGKRKNGIYCMALSEEENRAHNLVRTYMEEAGLDVRVDLAGNLIGRLEGEDKEAPILMIGSHLDSVYGGGIFDGRLGVLAGVEVLQVMNEQRIKPKCGIEVLAYRDEEATRFIGSYSGAGHLTGKYDPSIMHHVDKNDKTVMECLEACGIDPQRVEEAQLPKGYAKAHLELHIEQGGVLESENSPVGIVTGICCQMRGEIQVTGVASHAGTTPMHLRKDALTSAAEIILLIEEEAKKYQDTVATVGRVEVLPGGVNVIPESVKLSFDIRSQSVELRNTLFKSIELQSQEICKKRDTGIQITVMMQDNEVALCAPYIQDKIEGICKNVGIEPLRLPSGAGHDSSAFTDFCPMGMIFVRSKDGISHNIAEWSTSEDCACGANILYHTVLELSME